MFADKQCKDYRDLQRVDQQPHAHERHQRIGQIYQDVVIIVIIVHARVVKHYQAEAPSVIRGDRRVDPARRVDQCALDREIGGPAQRKCDRHPQDDNVLAAARSKVAVKAPAQPKAVEEMSHRAVLLPRVPTRRTLARLQPWLASKVRAAWRRRLLTAHTPQGTAHSIDVLMA
eukprot:6227439-Prymnesium_polylepis.2